ncbi:hypothetical protein SLE2022_236690 [Rubroshorea leprosula]
MDSWSISAMQTLHNPNGMYLAGDICLFLQITTAFKPPVPLAPLCCVTDGEFNSGIEFPTGEFIGETVGLLRFNFGSRKCLNGPGLDPS